MPWRILFHDVFYIIRLECFTKFFTCQEVLQLHIYNKVQRVLNVHRLVSTMGEWKFISISCEIVFRSIYISLTFESTDFRMTTGTIKSKKYDDEKWIKCLRWWLDKWTTIKLNSIEYYFLCFIFDAIEAYVKRINFVNNNPSFGKSSTYKNVLQTCALAQGVFKVYLLYTSPSYYIIFLF